ncbi:MAG: DNA mismatch repair protein MutS [Clostridiales bacterium 38_11]|nr:MAG: DNA mismatch repair protein MutS [Clostridiales bacterium 38_11]
MSKLTPMMQQYMKIKEKHKDSILFFRLGDFYEMFFDDALKASKILEITLTARDCGQTEKAPMCGIPFHAADSYIAKLIENGIKVAICEQVEEPTAKTIVRREVVRIITPGTVTDNNLLDEKKNNYLCAVALYKNDAAIAYVDVSTGNIYCAQFRENTLDKTVLSLYNELLKINPAEIITNKDLLKLFENYHLSTTDSVFRSTEVIDHSSDSNYYVNLIIDHFKVISIETLGIQTSQKPLVNSIGALLDYLHETQKMALTHINSLVPYHTEDYMVIDNSTRRNLELLEPIRGTDKKSTLFNVIDHTMTAMGARKLKKWLLEPLQEIKMIESRHEAVDQLYNNILISNHLTTHLKQVYDIERLISRIVYGNCNARDMNSLKQSIAILPDLTSDISSVEGDIFENISKNIDTLKDILELIQSSIEENPPVTVKEGNIIRDGYNEELDELRTITTHGKDWINSLIEQERETTGIKNLRIGYNKVFGYYIEVTKSYLKLVPDYYIRKQTLANAERYITPDLKDMEVKILSAESRIEKLEFDLFNNIRTFIKNQVMRIQKTADMVATVDAINSLCIVAVKNRYKRPKMNTDGIISIVDGRHPVVEKVLKNESFIPNSTYMDNELERFSIVTGPNMAGKSTYMRQIALIVILAHIGSFVPAEGADIAMIDKVFSRVGASDDLSSGQSTFMVEMSEVSNIIKNATQDSLIILDEIGRGTSTHDGLSIAWAVTEYISQKIKAKTLFATHYHELSELEGKIEGISNYKILIKESGDDIIFLRKISKGSIDKSFGIQVARLAGIPNDLIKRAFSILKKLEESDLNKSHKLSEKISDNSDQIAFWNINNKYKDFMKENIYNININNLTPLQCMTVLNDIIQKSKELDD